MSRLLALKFMLALETALIETSPFSLLWSLFIFLKDSKRYAALASTFHELAFYELLDEDWMLRLAHVLFAQTAAVAWRRDFTLCSRSVPLAFCLATNDAVLRK